jgi:predicted MFS family arabinose efflux permease
MVPASADDYFEDGTPGSFRKSFGIAVLAVGSFLVGSMLTVIIPILPNIAKEVAGGNATFATQILIAMPMLGLVLGGLLATVIFARIPPRTVFIGALVLYGLVGAFGAIASLPLLIASRLLIGVISACMGAASTALVGERVAPERRPKVLGWAVAGSSALGIVAMIISGRVADHVGWRSSFLIFPALAAIMLVMVLTCTTPSKPRAIAAARAGSRWNALVALWPIFLFVVLINITAFTTNSQSSFVLAENGIATAAGRAKFMGINQAMLVVAAFCFPFVRKLIGARLVPALILLAMGTGLTLLGTTQGIGAAALALGVLGIGNGLLFPYQSSLILQRATPAMRGPAAGLVVSCQFVADAINPLVLGPVIIAFGLRNTIAFVGLLALIACAGAVVVGLRYLSNAEPVRDQQPSHG